MTAEQLAAAIGVLKARGISQADIADKADVSVRVIQLFLGGKPPAKESTRKAIGDAITAYGISIPKTKSIRWE